MGFVFSCFNTIQHTVVPRRNENWRHLKKQADIGGVLRGVLTQYRHGLEEYVNQLLLPGSVVYEPEFSCFILCNLSNVREIFLEAGQNCPRLLLSSLLNASLQQRNALLGFCVRF